MTERRRAQLLYDFKGDDETEITALGKKQN
jgi:hypothetical protein